MFCDQVKIRLIAGKGGDGMVTFRREKFIPYGGPDGGNGGRGGDIYLVADSNINTLFEFNTRKVFRAHHGERGGPKKMNGKDATDIFLKVPCGTMIFDKDHQELIKDLKEEGEAFLAVQGGKGGFGNAHFASSVRQSPHFAELGEPGEDKEYFLELRLVADIGIIGLPSVGKSTLIAHISDARPKIADYPFTTLIPNLGVVYMSGFDKKSNESFVVADIPGLIEGASLGKGLGYDFLRHISRTAFLLHLVAANSQDVVKDYKIIIKELGNFDDKLLKKNMLVAVNKTDLINESAKEKIIKEFFKIGIINIYFISAVNSQGFKELIWDLAKQVKKLKKNQLNFGSEHEELKVFRPHLEIDKASWSIKKTDQKKHDGRQILFFEINGKRLEQIAVMTDFSNQEGLFRLYDVMNKVGVTKELKRLGAVRGDIIMIASKELEFLA